MFPLLPALILLLFQGLPGGDEICLTLLQSSDGSFTRHLGEQPLNKQIPRLAAWIRLKSVVRTVIGAAAKTIEVKFHFFEEIRIELPLGHFSADRTRDGPVTR